jgi:hypothetical protein
MASQRLPSLFGFTLGNRLTSTQEFTPSARDRDLVLVSRISKNMLQTLKLAKKSQTIAS